MGEIIDGKERFEQRQKVERVAVLELKKAPGRLVWLAFVSWISGRRFRIVVGRRIYFE